MQQSDEHALVTKLNEAYCDSAKSGDIMFVVAACTCYHHCST